MSGRAHSRRRVVNERVWVERGRLLALFLVFRFLIRHLGLGVFQRVQGEGAAVGQPAVEVVQVAVVAGKAAVQAIAAFGAALLMKSTTVGRGGNLLSSLLQTRVAEGNLKQEVLRNEAMERMERVVRPLMR